MKKCNLEEGKKISDCGFYVNVWCNKYNKSCKEIIKEDKEYEKNNK